MSSDSPAVGESPATRPTTPPRRVEWQEPALAAAALLILYLPTGQTLARHVWSTVEQSYGPVILAAAAWLLWQRLWPSVHDASRTSPGWGGVAVFCAGLLVYVFGRSQEILVLEAASIVPVIAGLILMTLGTDTLKRAVLPLVLLLFVVPLPPDLVAALTAPLKSAVSAVATLLLDAAGYPVARTGVIMMVGPYQLLVADACAGLTSIFTLEAIGLVYMGLRGHGVTRRNVALGLLLVPIAFVANVIRVIVLVLVTYHLGDEAGQGFVHSAAGILLFMVATGLMLITDQLLARIPALR